METNIVDLVCYHYTNLPAYESMRTGHKYGKSELHPYRRFLRWGWGSRTLPEKAHDNIVLGLLEPEPASWIYNKEFPHQWWHVMYDVCKEDTIMLLKFPVLPEDEAFITDRAHMEREFYRQGNGKGKSVRRTMSNAARRYWESRVPARDYQGEFTMPQFTFWSPIPFERLEVVWTKPCDEVWQRVLRNDW